MVGAILPTSNPTPDLVAMDIGVLSSQGAGGFRSMLETRSKMFNFSKSAPNSVRFFHFDEWNDHIGSQFWEFRKREETMKWRMQWKEKKEMERVEKEKQERVATCEMEVRGSEKDDDLSDILSEEEASEVRGEDVSWLEASDHFSDLEFEDDELLLSSVGAACEILTVEEDVEDKSAKPGIGKAKKKRYKHRGKFSSATSCLPPKALQQTPSSSSSKSCPSTSRPKAPQIPGGSSRVPKDWLAINLAGFIFFPFPFYISLNRSFSSFSWKPCSPSFLNPSL